MKIRCTQIGVVLLLTVLAVPRVLGGDLMLHLPDGVRATSAAALEPATAAGDDGPMIRGKVQGPLISFVNLTAGTPYDLKITLADGTILRGANLSWYSREPADPNAEPLNDDDRKQIAALVTDVKSFYNISRIVTLNGTHDRATVLVERIRSSAFHSDTGGEVIWRMEIWYFVNEFGGWAERTQTSKLLTRQRFKTNAEYRDAVSPIRWIGALGGITLGKSETKRDLSLRTDQLSPATQPSP